MRFLKSQACAMENDQPVTPIGITQQQGQLALSETIVDDDELRSSVDALTWRDEIARAGYFQVSKLYIDEITAMASRAPSASLVFWTLVKLMSKQNAVMISQESLAKLAKLSMPTVKRAVKLLRTEQWMEVHKIGTQNVYRVNAGVIWQDKLDGKWAAYNARVIVNFDEQDDMTKTMGPIRTRHIPLVEADDMTASPAPPDDGGRR